MPANGFSLTQRECEVLQLAATGKTSHEIAQALDIAKRSVDEHVAMTVRKLDATSRAHAVATAIRLVR